MRSLENDFAVEMKKLKNSGEEVSRLWEMRSEIVESLRISRKHLDCIFTEIMERDYEDKEKRREAMEEYEKINKSILEQSRIIASWDISK